MPEQTYTVIFESDHVPPWERCMLKEQLASVVRETLVIEVPVAIDQHEGDANRLSHEVIEHAFREPIRVVGQLPENIEKHEAQRLLKVVEDLTHQSREKRADR